LRTCTVITVAIPTYCTSAFHVSQGPEIPSSLQLCSVLLSYIKIVCMYISDINDCFQMLYFLYTGQVELILNEKPQLIRNKQYNNSNKIKWWN